MEIHHAESLICHEKRVGLPDPDQRADDQPDDRDAPSKAARTGDSVAQQLIDEVSDEIVITANAAIRRLRLTRSDVHVVLGGVLRGANQKMLGRIREGIQAVAPKARMLKLEAPPVLGAALIGLDEMGASEAARRRLRTALTHRRLSTG